MELEGKTVSISAFSSPGRKTAAYSQRELDDIFGADWTQSPSTVKRDQPVAEPKYGSSFDEFLEAATDEHGFQLQAQENVQDEDCDMDAKDPGVYLDAVSYTHLTLPTICSV